MSELVKELLGATAPKKKGAKVVSDLWEQRLIKGKNAAKKLIANVVLILTNHEDWRGAIAWDEFAERVIVVRAGHLAEGPWDDVCDVRTAIWLQQSKYQLEASPAMVAEAVRAVAYANRVHPLRERLNGLTWDGKARLDTWLVRYLGAEDTPVHREFGLRWMLGAVARAFEPGCQVDAALILEGLSQGEGKSSALRTLAMGFFTDELADVGNKDAAMQLHGAWIIELAELDAVGRAEMSRVKSFLTRRVDRYRAPYGRHVAEHARHCVFAGTVNHNDYLRDETGGRRFLPVEVGTIDLAALRADVEQLWAEAVARYRAGEPVYTTSSELRTLIGAHTATRYQEDAWHETVKAYVQVRDSVSLGEVFEHIGVKRENWTQSDANRIAKILKSLGYVRRQVTFEGRRQWRYLSRAHASFTGKTIATGASESVENQTPITTEPVSPVNNNNHTYINAEGLMGTGGAPVQSGALVHGEGLGEWLDREGIGHGDE